MSDSTRDGVDGLLDALSSPKAEPQPTKLPGPSEGYDGGEVHQRLRAPEYHPSVRHVLGYFNYAHLPERLAMVSAPFGELATLVARRAPDNPETTVALRKLLEAKDAAVRAALSEGAAT